MFGSNKPNVLGLVSIKAAVFSSTKERSSSKSTPPQALDFTVTTSKPAMTALAGLVPCAASGTITLDRFKSLF